MTTESFSQVYYWPILCQKKFRLEWMTVIKSLVWAYVILSKFVFIIIVDTCGEFEGG